MKKNKEKMRIGKKIGLLIVVFSFIALSSIAQGLSFKETVDFINKHSGGKYKVSIKKEREISVDFYKNGNVYRTDRVYVMTLDPDKTSYSEEEGALIIRCNSDLGKEFKKFRSGCFERTFHNKGKVAAYARMNLKMENDPKKIKELTNAWTHLIKMVHDEGDYMGVDTFEEK